MRRSETALAVAVAATRMTRRGDQLNILPWMGSGTAGKEENAAPAPPKSAAISKANQGKRTQIEHTDDEEHTMYALGMEHDG